MEMTLEGGEGGSWMQGMAVGGWGGGGWGSRWSKTPRRERGLKVCRIIFKVFCIHDRRLWFSWLWRCGGLLVVSTVDFRFKVGTHEGACSRSTLLQHAPGAKLPRLHQRFLAKKYVAQLNFCSRVLLPYIKLVWYEGASSGANLLHESVSGASSLVCTENCLPWHDVSSVGQSNWLIFFIHNSLQTHFQNGGRGTTSSHSPIGLFHHSAASSCPSCVLVGVLTRERVSGACFRSKLPRVYRPLKVGGSRPDLCRRVVSLYKKLCSILHCLFPPNCINEYRRGGAYFFLRSHFYPSHRSLLSEHLEQATGDTMPGETLLWNSIPNPGQLMNLKIPSLE